MNPSIKDDNEVMIDIETLSTKNNACILTIGAIKFNRRNGTTKSLEELTNEKKTFYVRIFRKSCLLLGMDIDVNTIEWWNTLPEEVRYDAIYNKENRMEIKQALRQLSEFLIGVNFFWSQGSFDYNVLENAYKVCNMPLPWKYWQLRDSRTMFDVFNVDLKSIKVDGSNSHNALDDSYKQILGLKSCLK
jgi:hypothetical protein